VLGSALKSWRDGALFEHLIVVGLPADYVVDPNTINIPKEQQILYKFPENVPVKNEILKSFCFPGGVEIKPVKTETELNSVIFGSLSQLETAENSFVYVITDDHLYYGTCVITHELLREPGCILESNMVNPPSSLDPYITKRCYCFISRFPFFNLHFEVLYSILAKDRLYRLTKLQNRNFNKEDAEAAAYEIKTLLAFYHNQTVPKAGSTMGFQLPGELRSLEFKVPACDDDTSMSDWSIPCLFRLLPLEMIVDLFTAVLLEYKIVLVCDNMGVLSAIGLSLLSILRPYIWQGVFIPILPEVMWDVIDAPVPYIVGVNKEPTHMSFEGLEIVVADLNKCTISPPGVITDEIPNRKQLMNDLRAHHDQLYVQSSLNVNNNYSILNPCRTTELQLQLTQKILQVFQDYQKKVLDQFTETIVKCKLTLEPETYDEDVSSITSALTRSSRRFASRLMNTQQFTFFSSKLMTSIKTRREESKEMMKTIKNLIMMEENDSENLHHRMKVAESTDNKAEAEKWRKEIQESVKRLAQLKETMKKLTEENPDLAKEINIEEQQREQMLRKSTPNLPKDDNNSPPVDHASLSKSQNIPGTPSSPALKPKKGHARKPSLKERLEMIFGK
jgi:hypothetical protein